MIAKDQQLAFFAAAIRDGNIDLHAHTTASDGSDTPLSLYRTAQANQLKVVAVTDHDTVAGLSVLEESEIPLVGDVSTDDWDAWFAARTDTYVLPGVELSCEFNDMEIHLLGYFLQPIGQALQKFLQEQKNTRALRNRQMIDRFRQLGYAIPTDLLASDGSGHTKGRVAVAHWLIDNGYAVNVNDAFDRFLLPGRPGYIERKRPAVVDAIRAIHRAGGVTSLAHPQQYPRTPEEIVSDITRMAESGLDAVEAFHTGSTHEQRLLYVKTARNLGLQITAGSDYHGINKDNHPLYSHMDFSDYFSN